jgi:hypothetical protein
VGVKDVRANSFQELDENKGLPQLASPQIGQGVHCRAGVPNVMRRMALYGEADEVALDPCRIVMTSVLNEKSLQTSRSKPQAEVAHAHGRVSRP